MQNIYKDFQVKNTNLISLLVGIGILTLMSCSNLNNSDDPSVVAVELDKEPKTEQITSETTTKSPTGIPTLQPEAEPTPRDRISILLTPVAPRPIPKVLQGVYENPIPTPAPITSLDPRYKESYSKGEQHLVNGKELVEKSDYESGDAEFRSAELEFSKAIEIHGQITEGYLSRGTAYLELGEWDKAMQDFDSAIKINHSLVSPFAGRAIVYKISGNEKEAKENIDAAIFNGMDRKILTQYISYMVGRLKTRYRYN